MEKDLVYVFDKISKQSSVLGEIQSDFNMSLVIDGTKDSTTIIVLSYSGVEIEPYSIILHKKTMSWWCVSHDKVERYQNDNGGFVYIHNLELVGAIEILNARDLTDCGFNNNSYTVENFLKRLFKLSNIEYNEYSISIVTDSVFKNKQVDYIKTFENYTLLSAIKEFLDAYNMCPKLTFGYSYNSITNVYTINSIVLTIIPKTGNKDRVHQMSEFDDVRETKTMDKDSFGTSVVSNAENVISTQAKLYPSIGTVKLSSKEWDITRDNAILRLPTNVFKINWVALYDDYHCCTAPCEINGIPLSIRTLEILDKYCNPTIKSSVIMALNQLESFVVQKAEEYGKTYFATHFQEEFENAKENIANNIIKANTIRFFNGNNINASNGDIIRGSNVPYVAEIDTSDGDLDYRKIGLFDKETRNMLKYTQQGLYWDRGSNLIEGFKGIVSIPVVGQPPIIKIKDGNSTDYQSNSLTLFTYEYDNDLFSIVLDALSNKEIRFRESQWKVNYVPMSDIKIKIDNRNDKRDIQLYNQNGKLTDSVALSKLLNSYSKEISSDTITRYMHYYSYNDIPNVGDIVVNGNDEYVINNISMDFTQNETSVNNDFGYFIDCEITMSKWVSTKSLMVNPNTNIRDYGIPQNFNIKRKQLYRDYYELSYTLYDDANIDTPYLNEEQALFFGHEYLSQNNFICQMKIGYENNVNGQQYWYYQLETTTYILDKMQYVICDLLDNNIIGYSFMNMWSGIDISKIFDLGISINTPIQYTDDNGKFENIKLLFLTPTKLDENINEYKDFIGRGSDYTPIYNASCFIDSVLFSFSEYNFDIEINEEKYNKDALEIPVFEYVLQIGDSDNVLIGDNILQQHSGFKYFYFYTTGSNLNQNNVDSTNTFVNLEYTNIYRQYNSVDIAYDSVDNPKLKLTLYGYTNYDTDRNLWSNAIAPTVVPINSDIAVFRRAFNPTTLESIIELMFIVKNVPSTAISDTQVINLMINHYKLK